MVSLTSIDFSDSSPDDDVEVPLACIRLVGTLVV